jgi:hypothetical protein
MAGTYTNIVQGGASVTISSDLGFIADGVVITPSFEMSYGKAEGIPAHLTARRPISNYDIAFTLLEMTLANFKIAWDIKNAVSGSAPATLKFGGENFVPTENVLVVYGYTPGATSYARSVTFQRTVVSAPGEFATKDSDPSSLAVTLHALYYPTGTCVGTFSDAAS